MRLSEDTIKQAILHPDRNVRDAAALYFSRAFSRDPSVMPLAIRAIEKYGWEDAFSKVAAMVGLALDDQTVPWIVHQLRRDDQPDSDLWAQFTHVLRRMLAEADARLLSRHAFPVLSVLDSDPDAYHRATKKLDLLKLHAETCWNELQRFCEDERDVEYVHKVDVDYAYALVEALARHGAAHADRVLSILAQKIDDPEGNPQTWMEGFMVRLAGELRLEAAVPLITQKARYEDAEWLSGLCQDALVKIGTDTVVEAVSEGFQELTWYQRMSACSVLENVHTDLAVRKSLDLLQTEEDPTIKTCLGQALNAQFAEEAVEPVRQLILSGQTDLDFTDLRFGLVAAAALTGVDFPEREEWKVQAEQERHRRREYSARLAEEPLDEQDQEEYDEEYADEEYDDNDEISLADDDYDYHEPPPPPTTIISKERVGRNQPCPCGSGKKYKKCCLRKPKDDLPFP